MRDDDLPLLAWRPPCKLLAFPLINRVGKIRRTAEVLEGKTGNDASGYLRHQLRLTREHLEKIGCRPEDIENQVQEFHEAIRNELNRRAYEGLASGNNQPGGAA